MAFMQIRNPSLFQELTHLGMNTKHHLPLCVVLHWVGHLSRLSLAASCHWFIDTDIQNGAMVLGGLGPSY
jgi:hypothetical protein